MAATRSRRYLALAAVLLLGITGLVLGPALTRFDFTAIGTRASWQLPEQVVQALALEPGAVVADIGAGDGYFTFRLARAVSESGRVFAVDIDAGIVNGLRAAALQRGVGNVEAVLARADDPQLPDGSVDLALVCNVYHHIEARQDYFRALRRDLAPGGRVAIIEMTGRLPLRWLGPPGHWTSADTLRREMEEAGYRLVTRDDFLPLQNFFLFESAGQAQR